MASEKKKTIYSINVLYLLRAFTSALSIIPDLYKALLKILDKLV